MTTQEIIELKPRVERLNELRAQIARVEGRENLSDADFVRRFLPFSSTTWSKLQSGTYGGGFDTIARRLDDAIADVEGRLPNIEDAVAKRKAFRRTTLARSVLTALAAAREGQDDRRVVMVLAPTGGGKTAIRDYLATRGAVCAEGRQAWRSSYRAFCLDIARSAGRKLPPTMPRADALKTPVRVFEEGTRIPALPPHRHASPSITLRTSPGIRASSEARSKAGWCSHASSTRPPPSLRLQETPSLPNRSPTRTPCASGRRPYSRWRCAAAA